MSEAFSKNLRLLKTRHGWLLCEVGIQNGFCASRPNTGKTVFILRLKKHLDDIFHRFSISEMLGNQEIPRFAR